MKSPSLLTLTFAALLGLPSALAAQDIYLFDFGGDPTLVGPAPDDPVNTWNNLDNATATSETGILFDLQDVTGEVTTGMNLEMVRRFSGSNGNGSRVSTLYPGNASGDSLYGHTEAFSGLTNIFPAFKLTGLDTSLSYDFTFFAARLGVSDNRETQYTLTGANSATALLDAANNDVDRIVTSTGISPDAAGEILIEIAPGAANDNVTHFTYLGALRLETSPSVGELAIATNPESVSVTEYESATFRVSATGAGPFTVQWSKDGVEIADATDFAYFIPEASLALDGSAYSATISNATSSVTSTEALLTVAADVVRPTALSVGVKGSTGLVVTFSEPLDPAKGAAISSYTVSDSSGNAVISSVTLSEDGTEVQLILDRQIGGAFTVSLAGVTDRAGNALDPALNTISGTAASADVVTYLVDFGGDTLPDDILNTWNLVSGSIGQNEFGILEKIATTTGEASAVSIKMISRFTGVNTAGATNSNLYPREATVDSLYGNTEEWQGLSNIFPSFKLTGLDSNMSHTLTFYAARLGAGDNRETKYTVTGGEGEVIALFDPANNSTDQSVNVEDIYPDESGEITVALTPGDNNNNEFHFTYLNVLRVDAEPGASQDLRVTDFQVDRATNTMSLSWIARTNVSYSVFTTDDLADLKKDGDVADSVTDNGAEDLDPEQGRIRFEFPNPDPAKAKLFFSVHRN